MTVSQWSCLESKRMASSQARFSPLSVLCWLKWCNELSMSCRCISPSGLSRWVTISCQSGYKYLQWRSRRSWGGYPPEQWLLDYYCHCFDIINCRSDGRPLTTRKRNVQPCCSILSEADEDLPDEVQPRCSRPDVTAFRRVSPPSPAKPL